MRDQANHIESGPYAKCVLNWIDRYRRALFTVLILLYLGGFNGQWRVGPDSAAFAAIARNVAEGHGFVHPIGFEGNVSPGLIYLLAGSFKLLGNDTFWPVTLIILLLAMGTFVLIYRTMLMHADRPTAVTITLMVGESALMYRYTIDVLNTIPFLFGAMLLLWSHERSRQGVGKPAINHVVTIFSFLWMAAFRIVFINMLAAWLLVMFVQAMRSPHRRRILISIVSVIALLFLLRMLDPRARAGGLLPREQEIVDRLLSAQLTERVPENAARLFQSETPNAFLGNDFAVAPISITFSLLAIGSMIILGRRRLLWGVLPILFVIQWLLFFADARYFAPLLPLMALGWWHLWVAIERRWPRRVTGLLLLFMTGMWPVMNIPRSVGFLIEQRRTPFYETYAQGQFRGVRAFTQAIMEQTNSDCWILGTIKMSSAMGYWSRRRIYPPVAGWLSHDLTGPGYIITPLDDEQKAMLADPARGWSIGQAVLEVPGPAGKEPWKLHRIETKPTP